MCMAISFFLKNTMVKNISEDLDTEKYQVHEDKLRAIFVCELLCFLEYICLINLDKKLHITTRERENDLERLSII